MSIPFVPMPAGEPSRPSSARRRKLARMVLVLACAITLAALPVAADGEGTTAGAVGAQTAGAEGAQTAGAEGAQTAGAEGAQTAGAEGVMAVGKWTQPAILSSCPGTGTPHVVFPSDSPTHGTGPGAIVWSTSSPCPAGAGVLVAAISPEDDDIPGQAAPPRTANGQTIALRGSVAATPGPYGRIVIAGASAGGEGATPAGELLLSEGRAGGPFASPTALGGPASTFAFTTAYLGDVAFASLIDGPSGDGGGGQLQAGRAGFSPGGAGNDGTGGGGGSAEPGAGGDDGGGGVQLRVQRHHANRFAAPDLIGATGAESSSVQTLTVALDYRSDALAVWSAQGSLYARELPASGAPQPAQRLGPGPPPGARIAAVLSDDDRAIVAWSDRHDGQTSVYVSRSQPGVRFTGPQLLEEFPDPPDLPDYVVSPRLIRLSSESVMLAWTGAVAGHWAIRVAAIDMHGVHPAGTISPPGRDALLADLAPGPDDEALALWTEPLQTAAGLDVGSQAIFAARGFDAYPGRTAFAAGESIAPPGPNSEATVALDPDSDRAVAAWRTGAGALAYAIRAPGAP
jgi:hypothetical protein